ncbi:MAG: SMC-Scp complex subunit ScpB [Chlamydiia bacterium]|nr:SMC-Scp complex subunit ScpB [Chlamydiia bacterium]
MGHEINLLNPVSSTTPDERVAFERKMKGQVKKIIEACLFASSDPIPFGRLKDITDEIYPLKPRAFKELIEDLREEYISQGRAFRLEEIAEGFLLRSLEEYSPYIEKLGYSKRQEKLSHAALETLAIIAFRGPITRPEVEKIRGVDATGTFQNLLERGLIEPAGKLEAPGRPVLFKTTPLFLKYFGLKDLKDLPEI